MTPDFDLAARFLEQLRPNGPWVLTAIVPDGPTTTRTFDRLDLAREFVATHNTDKNIYYSLNPTKTALTKKATKGDIAQAEYVHADLDPEAGETPEAAKARYLSAIEKLEHSPTAVIDSGNGVQALWELETEVEPNRFAEVEACSKALTLLLGAKAGTQNIDRVLRLPGTINHPNETKRKAGRVACMAQQVWFNGARYPLEALPQGEPERPGSPSDGGHHEHQQEDLPPYVIGLLLHPNQGAGHTCGGYPTRSEALFAFLKLALIRGSHEATIIAKVTDIKYAGCGIYEHVRENGGERYLKEQIARAKRDIRQPESKTVELVCAKDVIMRPIDYLWTGHLIRGNQELMTGVPDMGKSQIQCFYAACVTTGCKWPDGSAGVPRGNVIMVTAEDTR